MKVSTIEKFIESYMQSVKPKAKKKGYAEWIAENGKDPIASLSESVGKISAENERQLSPYSKAETSLSGIGLSGSGYARYLKERSGESGAESIEKAVGSYLATDTKNKKGYEAELIRRENEEKKAAELLAKEEARKEAEAKKEAEKLAKAEAKANEEKLKAEEKRMTEIYKKVKEGLSAADYVDYGKAYEYAIGLGLGESDAEYLAKTYTEAARNAKINKVTSAIVSKRYSMNQAREYALTLGLSREDAEALGEFAFKTNESVTDIVTQEGYLDYLREQYNKNK